VSSQDRLVAGRYRLIEIIGAGDIGIVWRAHDEQLQHDVAVKEIRYPAIVTAEERARLTELALSRGVPRLDHPNIVGVHDVIEHDERPWIVMTFVDGRSLDRAVRDSGPLDAAATARLGLNLLGALEAAHAAGVLHGDIKPSDVLIQPDGRAVLGDFAIAPGFGTGMVTPDGVLLGSPGPVAPERMRGGAAGPPSDLFGLGATLYYAAEGHGPFDHALAGLYAAASEPHSRPRRASPPLVRALDGLLMKDPAERWDIERTRTALQTIQQTPVAIDIPTQPMPMVEPPDPLAAAPVPAFDPTPLMVASPDLPASRRRGAALAAAGAVVVVLLLSTMTVAFFRTDHGAGGSPATPPPTVAGSSITTTSRAPSRSPSPRRSPSHPLSASAKPSR
jgi:eukaryotic-like serine/threonine-protein kinase